TEIAELPERIGAVAGCCDEKALIGEPGSSQFADAVLIVDHHHAFAVIAEPQAARRRGARSPLAARCCAPAGSVQGFVPAVQHGVCTHSERASEDTVRPGATRNTGTLRRRFRPTSQSPG